MEQVTIWEEKRAKKTFLLFSCLSMIAHKVFFATFLVSFAGDWRAVLLALIKVGEFVFPPLGMETGEERGGGGSVTPRLHVGAKG